MRSQPNENPFLLDKLQEKLVTKNEVIVELMEENVKAKKNLGSPEGRQ